MKLKVGGALLYVLAAVFIWLSWGAATEVSAAVGTDGQVELAGTPALHEHAHHPGGALQGEGTAWDVLSFILKVMYYIMFTLFLGWVLWSGRLRSRSITSDSARQLGVLLERVHFLTLLGYAFVYLYDLQQTVGEDLASSLLGYVQGWSVAALVILSLLGFAVFFKNRILDLVLVLLMVAARSLGGHSTNYDMQWLTLPSYMIHWLAVAVWLGGVFFALFLWRKHRELMKEWLPIVSGAALWSVIALFVTGILTAVVYLPSIEYVYGTDWGRWLLIKVGAVALVIIISLFVRRAWRRADSGLGRTLAVELTAMTAVLLIVGLLTSQHPTPHEEPLDWHVMGEEIHMTLQITPNQPGLNTFVVKVWLPEEQTGPQSVELSMQHGDQPVKQVGLTPVENEYTLSFPGFTEHRYRGQGNHLDRPGTWTVFVQVVDENGAVTDYEREIEVW